MSHEAKVMRSGDGLIGVCSCRKRQLEPVPTREEAEDWITEHTMEVVRIQTMLAKPLSPVKYLAWLEECAADLGRSEQEREQWQMLATEYGARVKGKKSSYDTGVETAPLW